MKLVKWVALLLTAHLSIVLVSNAVYEYIALLTAYVLFPEVEEHLQHYDNKSCSPIHHAAPNNLGRQICKIRSLRWLKCTTYEGGKPWSI